MDVDNSRELRPLLVSDPGFRTSGNYSEGSLRRTHAVAKKSAIIFNTSVSLFVVSSNPGVSMRTTRLPSRVNSLASCTSSVHEVRFTPTGRFEWLARLMN